MTDNTNLNARTRQQQPSTALSFPAMPDRDSNADAEADPQDHTPVPSDLDDLFKVLIVKNDRVCSECFTRLARRVPFPTMAGHDYAAILSFVETVLPEGAKWELLDRRYYERVQLSQRTERAYPTTDEPTSGGTTVCRNCGTTEPYRTLSTPRPTTVALEHATSLSDTLTEYGIDHDTETLINTVSRLKRDSDWTSRDHDIFARAVANAIRSTSDSLGDPQRENDTDTDTDTDAENEGDHP